MIEFSLSKLNLLIFVLSIAAIVLFFMNTVNSNLKTRQSYELSYKLGQQVESILNSESYCSSKYVFIPNTIKLNYGKSQTQSLPYILRIYNYTSDSTSDDQNKLIFGILNNRTKEIIAAYDVDYNGIVNFYEWTYNGSYTYNKIPSNNDDHKLDFKPSKKESVDSKIIFAKKIVDGRQEIHIFACADTSNNKPACSDQLTGLINIDGVNCLCIIPELANSTSACDT